MEYNLKEKAIISAISSDDKALNWTTGKTNPSFLRKPFKIQLKPDREPQFHYLYKPFHKIYISCMLHFFFFPSETSCCPDRHFPAKVEGVLPSKRQVSPFPCCYHLHGRPRGEPCRQDPRGMERGPIAFLCAPRSSSSCSEKNPFLPEHNSVLITFQNPELYSTGV